MRRPMPLRAQRELLDVFTCIRNHVTLARAGRLLERNSERHVKSPAEMARLFADLPEAIAHTAEISARLEFTLADLGYEFPRYPVPEGETEMSFLRQLRRRGRAPALPARTMSARTGRSSANWRLSKSFDLPGYFLIVWDIVRFCREKGILAQGRGSAANSAVCYALQITAVDPVGMELLFERFLSEERGEWPDIDIDLPSGDQRERAIQYVYRALRQAGRGHDRQRHHLSRPIRRARGGQGAGLRNQQRSKSSPAWRAPGNGRTRKTPPSASSAKPASTSIIRACASFSSCTAWRRICRATWASTRAAW